MTSPAPTSILRSLRSVVPQRNVSFAEALQVAELQASKLHELIDSPDGISEVHIAQLPRVRIVRETGLVVSGMSHWNGTAWIITLNANDSLARQRFTLLHELKHVIDHGFAKALYSGRHHKAPAEQAETAADYFAGCALVPKRYLKSVWGDGIQAVADLAAHFGVSEQAVRVRLAQTGLNAPRDLEPAPRCAHPVKTSRSQSQRFYTATRTRTRRAYT